MRSWKKYWLIHEDITLRSYQKSKKKKLNNPEIDILNEKLSQLIIEEAKEDEKESKAPEIINSKKIKEIDMIELEAYIGVIIMMGIDRKPNYHMHWNTHGLWESSLISKALGLKRFINIGSIFHLSDPFYSSNSQDKLEKLNPLMSQIEAKSQQYYLLEQSKSIDESMIAFKGRNSMKQYLPMKPTKWGFNNFVLAGSSNGYIYRFIIYLGKKWIFWILSWKRLLEAFARTRKSKFSSLYW
ncbi:unnamed protein product [Blepharisma stoltei]|uniref:PiggyBac transposable element-derived protein domain-containing protein n=1 Tax=Blepharisma stoltei TaxID=1481888 RepID=A0AAU9JC47_9CILI|nr:unnamed protein product [Blepharisma stoltei]